VIETETERLFETASAGAASNRTSDAKTTYDDRLNHILEVATRLIARVGYQNASMRAVAKAAKVSLAGIYHYFDSKEKMLFLIQSRSFSSLLNNLREKLHGVSDPKEQIAVMIRAHVEYFAANIAALKVCSHELDSLTGEAYEQTHVIRRRYYDETRKIIDRLLDSYGVNGGIDRHVATMYLFGALNWLYRWYDPKRGRPPSSIAKQITAHFLHGVIGLPSAGGRSRNDRATSSEDPDALQNRRRKKPLANRAKE
jgi:AcrR family transcriptional regulator